MALATATYIPDPNNPGQYIKNPALPQDVFSTTPDYSTFQNQQSITNDSLTPVTGQPFVNSAPTPASPITVPTPAANELSAPQQQQSDINKRLQELNDVIAGKPAYEIQQREQFGISAKETTKQSLINQLGQLKAYTENIPAQLQQESTGRGITAGGLEPIQYDRLRQAGIQANILNANYAAASGDLALAESHVQRAVQDKFAPYEAERDAKLKNLQLVKDSPEATIAEKNRATATEAKIKDQYAEKEAVKSVFNDILKLSTSVSSSATHDENSNLVIKEINDFANSINYDNTTGKPLTTRAEAVNLFTQAQQKAQRYIAKQPTGIGDVNDFKQFFPNVDITTPAGQKQFLDWKAKTSATGLKTSLMGVDTTGLPANFANAIQQGKTGNDLLNSLKPVDKATIQSILDYTKNPANLSLRKSAGETQSEREKFLGMAHLIDPSYDETQYATRSAIKKDFNSGKSAQNIRSLNTAVGHLDTLSKAGNKLENASLPLWNSIANAGLSAIGDPRVVAFNTAATAVESELASVFKGMGASDQEIKTWRDNINSSQSPAQLKGAIDTAIELMGSRLQALTNQYEIGIGKPKDFRILSDKSRQILSGLGVDVEALDPIKTPAQGVSGTSDTSQQQQYRSKYNY